MRSGPPKQASLDFITDVSGGIGDMIKSVFTFGYFKGSLKLLIMDLKNFITRQPLAAQGQNAPGGKLVSLDGKSLRLENYIFKSKDTGMPLILNFGSCT